MNLDGYSYWRERETGLVYRLTWHLDGSKKLEFYGGDVWVSAIGSFESNDYDLDLISAAEAYGLVSDETF